jgi:hypothetical protein
MKKIAILLTLVLCATSCIIEDYAEGHIDTFEVAEVTSYSAFCGGKVVIDKAGGSFSYIIDKGIMFGIGKYSLTEQYSSNTSGEGEFHCWLNNLEANTIYYYKVYAAVTGDDYGYSTRYFYGELKEFTTLQEH